MNKLILVTLFALFAGSFAANYAVLVAGSNGYSNYRHQADVCHAYQLLLEEGYSAENVIVLSYNDVANNKKNPFKGQLFNKPAKTGGDNVNAGCVIDYQGAAVTPANYIAIIQGQANKVSGGNGRVLQSGPEDHVFLSFFDHGAPGLIAFPSKNLYASDLLAAFQYMYANNMYARLVYYLEACESGSMFQKLPNNINVYAVSAANPTQSSYAAYCGTQASVNGKKIGSCLGDEFSVNWMEDTEARSNLFNYSLQSQWVLVAKQTTGSQVMQWGDVSWTSEAVGDFLTGTTQGSETKKNSLRSYFNFKNPQMNAAVSDKGTLDSRLVTLTYLLDSFTDEPSAENYMELTVELARVEKASRKFEQIAENFNLTGIITELSTDFSCYSKNIDLFENSCGKIPESQLGKLKYLYEFCNQSSFQNLDISQYLLSIC